MTDQNQEPETADQDDLPFRASVEILRQFHSRGYVPLLMVFYGSKEERGFAITAPLLLRSLVQAVPGSAERVGQVVTDYLTKLSSDTPMDDWPGKITNLRGIIDKPKGDPTE